MSVEAPRKLAGSVVSAVTETVKDKDGDERQITRVSLLDGATVEQFVLEDAEGLKFDDPRLGAQVDTALKALRAAHDRSGRDIAIRLAAGGKRTVRLGYVAEAPVWKAAYRLSLPGEAGGKARLQRWAVLENIDRDGMERRGADPDLGLACHFPAGALRPLLCSAPDGRAAGQPAGAAQNGSRSDRGR